MILINTAINWERCRRNTISADAALPENIRTLRVSALDGISLHAAMRLIGGDVTSVNIETSNTPPNLIGFPHQYIQTYGPFTLEFAPTQSFDLLKYNLSKDFETRIRAGKTEADKVLIEAWKKGINAMIEAAAKIWPHSYSCLHIHGEGRYDQRDIPGFHRHGGLQDILRGGRILPGYLLNYTPSYDGTMFPGTDGNLWYAKGGTYSLFTTDDHADVNGCDHTVPDKFHSPIDGERRATAVLMVYPIPEI